MSGKKMTETDWIKREVAIQLGLGDKLRDEGWGGLTAAEAGRIGGLVGGFARRQRAVQQEEQPHGGIRGVIPGL